MPNTLHLSQSILAALAAGPLTFAGIQEAVGKREDYALGIALGKLVLAGEIGADKKHFASHWPQYWVGERPKPLHGQPRRS